ncbi:MAG: hypothetical protein ACI4TX_02025 [Christensenellales bacterium]
MDNNDLKVNEKFKEENANLNIDNKNNQNNNNETDNLNNSDNCHKDVENSINKNNNCNNDTCNLNNDTNNCNMHNLNTNENLNNDNINDNICENGETTNTDLEEKDKVRKRKQKGKKQSFFVAYLRWPLIVLITALILSFSFSILSEMALNNATLIVAIIVIVIFALFSMITDIIGVAITAVDIMPFRSMSAKKVSGAKEAIVLIKNADKVASVFADICGDICGILSGAAGAVVTNFYLQGVTSSNNAILIASLVSAIIAGIIIFSKALGKKFAITHCDTIVLFLGKILKVLTLNKISNKKKK